MSEFIDDFVDDVDRRRRRRRRCLRGCGWRRSLTVCVRPLVESLLLTHISTQKKTFFFSLSQRTRLTYTMPIHGLPPTISPSYPLHFSIESVIRPNILALHPYRCARDDYTEGILLDANENALGHAIASSSQKSNNKANGTITKPTEENGIDVDFEALDLHRYPDPAQRTIKTRIAALRSLKHPNTGVPKDDFVFLGVGSDEVLDLLMRVCVAPGREKILVTPPTYGMYGVCAQVNDVEVVKVPLVVEGGAFQLDVPAVCGRYVYTRIIF